MTYPLGVNKAFTLEVIRPKGSGAPHRVDYASLYGSHQVLELGSLPSAKLREVRQTPPVYLDGPGAHGSHLQVLGGAINRVGPGGGLFSP